MNRLLPILCACALVACVPPASAEPQGEIIQGMAAYAMAEPPDSMGKMLVAKVENAEGSTLRISCDAGRSGRAAIAFHSKRLKFRHKERLQIVVGAEAFEFDFKPHAGNGLAEISASGTHDALARMIRMIGLTKAKQLVVEAPLVDQREIFQLTDLTRSLDRRKGEEITEACL